MSLENLTAKPELACLKTELSLNANPAQPINIRENTNVLDMLMSPRFLDPFQLRTDYQINGKEKPSSPSVNPGTNKRRVYYSYEKPDCEEIENCDMDVCTPSNPTTESTGYLALDIDQCAADKWETTLSDFQSICSMNEFDSDPAARRAKRLRDAYWRIKKSMNRNAITQLLASASNYADGTSPDSDLKSIPLFNPNGDLNTAAMSILRGEMRRSNYNGDWYLFGGDSVAKWYDIKELRLSPEGRLGIQSGVLDSIPFVYDSMFDSVASTVFAGTPYEVLSQGVLVPVGSFAIATWNEFTGKQEHIMPDYAQTTMRIEDLLLDYKLKIFTCDTPVWSEALGINYGFLSLPNEMYCDSNALIRRYSLTCGMLDCDSLC